MTGPNNGKDRYFLEALEKRLVSIKTSLIGTGIGIGA
jgi:hypothetical protein